MSAVSITVSRDNTLTRKGAALMRENGVTGVTGSTTLASARAKARKAQVEFVFVSATNESKTVKAKRTSAKPKKSTTRTTKAWTCECKTLREHIKAHRKSA